MSELLKLAEAYYMVAHDLDLHAQEFARVANLLNRRADVYCEQNIAEAPERERAGEVICPHCGRGYAKAAHPDQCPWIGCPSTSKTPETVTAAEGPK